MLKPQESLFPNSSNRKITIGILGLTYGASTFPKYRDKVYQIEQKVIGLIDKSGKKTSLNNDTLKSLLKGDIIFEQLLDKNIANQNYSTKEILQIIRQHRLKFEKKTKTQNHTNKDYQGNKYLYYSTAYAKMLFGWNQFQMLIPDKKHSKMFQNTWNPYIRTVPIDHTIGREDIKRTKLKNIIPKLDGIIFTGGNSSFYKGIQTEKSQGKFTKMSQEKLMDHFLEQLNQKAENSKNNSILKRKKTQYFEGLSKVLEIVKEINRTEKPFSKKIPILGICLGFEGLLLDAAGDTCRLGFVSDQYLYHDVYPTYKSKETLPKDPLSSLKSFMRCFYKNPIFFPKTEHNCYFNHTKMVSLESFEKDSKLPKEYKVLAVSYANDKGLGNLTFKDQQDWQLPQKKTLVVFPMNSDAIEQKIKNQEKIFFQKPKNRANIKPDFRLQQKKDVALIYKCIRLVKTKLDSKLSEEIRENYSLFVYQANEYLDQKLNRQNRTSYLRKLLNTNYHESCQEFISVIEGRHDPIFGLQFHIEKSLYNFDRNPSVKNSTLSRIKDHLITKFFLYKVLEEKKNAIKSQHKTTRDDKLLDDLNLFNWINQTCFSPERFAQDIIHYKSEEPRFDFESLYCKLKDRDNKNGKEYDTNSEYNNNLSQQILRDYDKFNQEIREEKVKAEATGLKERFIIRGIGKESEALVFKKMVGI